MLHGTREILLGEISHMLPKQLSQQMLHRQVCQCVFLTCWSLLWALGYGQPSQMMQTKMSPLSGQGCPCPLDGKCELKTLHCFLAEAETPLSCQVSGEMWLSAGLLWHFWRLFWWVKLKISVHQRPEVGNSLQCLFTCTAPCSWWGCKGWRSLYQAISFFTEEDVWEHRADLNLHLLL